MRDCAVSDWNNNHMFFSNFYCFCNCNLHISPFGYANANFVNSIANHNQGFETEASTAFDNTSYTINIDCDFFVLFWFVLLFITVTPSTISAPRSTARRRKACVVMNGSAAPSRRETTPPGQ